MAASDCASRPQKLSWLKCSALLCLSYGMPPRSIWKRQSVSPSSCRLSLSAQRCSGLSMVAKRVHNVCTLFMILLSFFTWPDMVCRSSFLRFGP